MNDYTIEYSTGGCEWHQWAAIAMNSLEALADFICWCRENEVQPLAVSVSKDPK